jgi:hypothetical protein
MMTYSELRAEPHPEKALQPPSAYLLSCAGWTDAKLTHQLQHAPWDALQGLFEELRGVPLPAFLSYPDLDLLAQLGNACRHGAGRAASALWRSHPDLWPHSAWPADSAVAPPVEHMQMRLKAKTALP